MRVLAVDDAVTFRQAIREALSRIPGVTAVDVAQNGEIALRKTKVFRPDVVLLDVEMPVLGGIETLRALREEHPGVAVIMFSAHTQHGAKLTIQALMLGAADFITKPETSTGIPETVGWIEERLREKLSSVKPGPAAAARPAPAQARPKEPAPVTRRPRSLRARKEVLAIGSSAGGPVVLRQIVSALPSDFPLPIVCVQHMPPGFTTQLARSLDKTSRLEVREAESGVPLRPGTMLVAPGHLHLEVRRGEGDSKVAILTDGAPRQRCKPSVDVLFESVADIYGPSVLAVVCSGMGRDGTDGCERVDALGGTVLVQDEETSLVWGMPGSVAQAGLACEILPGPQLASAVMLHAQGLVPTRRDP